MTREAIITKTLANQFEQALARSRVVLFSAPCGFGKTTVARALLPVRSVCMRNVDDLGFSLPDAQDRWSTLLLDNLQSLTEPEDQQALCDLIRQNTSRQFVLLSRGSVPRWLLPFQIAGVLSVLDSSALCFDRQSTAKLLEQYEVTVTDTELTAIQTETKGYPLAVTLLAQHMAHGEPCDPATVDRVLHDLFLYYEEAVFCQFDLRTQRLLMNLAPFEPFGTELVRLVGGSENAPALLERVQRDTTMLIQERMDTYHFWPMFQRFLFWKLEQTSTPEQLRSLYSRGGLHYELNEDFGRALECYSRSGEYNKVSDILIKNAELHPGMGHYYEMEKYYRMLPESEILASPALMQAMSMLCAMTMEFEQSERWYRELKAFTQCRRRTDAVAKEARSRMAWLDIALPQRGTDSMLETFPAIFNLLTAREIRLPPFSVTSALPSLMNGGKDFSRWSLRDDLIYSTMRMPVEAVLGRDGVCMADCALAESKFEKGEDITSRMFALMSNLERIRREGTPDIEFAVIGLLARAQVDNAHAADARRSLELLRERFVEAGETRFLANVDAMICRVDLHLNNDVATELWYRDSAPKNPQILRPMQRYQYLTQAMVELVQGENRTVLLTLAPLRKYCETCSRYIDSIHLNVLCAIALRRLGEKSWEEPFRAALDTAYEYGFVRPVSVYGASVLPLLESCKWNTDAAFFKKLCNAAQTRAVCYPDFLRARINMKSPLSAAELQVLRLLCADKSNAEIGEMLGIRLATVKVHVSHILDKLRVNRRAEAKTAAQRFHLI